jgi:hypothetical protein
VKFDELDATHGFGPVSSIAGVADLVHLPESSGSTLN